MKLGIAVNDLNDERAVYTTTHIAMAAANRGHEVWYIGVADFAYDPDGLVRARAVRPARDKYKTAESFFKHVQGPEAIRQRITVDELDVLFLRNNPADDYARRNWAKSAGIVFGRPTTRNGVIVLNDPDGLSKAENKMYFQGFPESVRPDTLITRDRAEIREFAEKHGDTIVLKPLAGSGGQSVFLVRRESIDNLNQMVDAVSRDGYVIAQEYLPAAAEGDIRLFMMNGAPLRYKGKYAAYRRVGQKGDHRSNIHSGGEAAQAEITPEALELAEMVRPKLVEDGMFLVGLDIVGNKLMEINVFSPGGLGNARRFEGVNFAVPVVQALERKVEYMRYYQRRFSNNEMATL